MEQSESEKRFAKKIDHIKKTRTKLYTHSFCDLNTWQRFKFDKIYCVAKLNRSAR